MKNYLLKKFDFGRLSISIYKNEIAFVYIGRKHIYIKTFKYNLSFNTINIPYVSSILMVLISMLLVTNHSVGEKKYESVDESAIFSDVNLSDEEKKNRLLKSSFTDFTKENNSDKLSIYTHKILRGEVLSAIAKKYGVSMDTICGSNNLESYDLIREGAILNIPNKDGILFKVKKGTEITKVAKKYKVSLKKIFAQNDLINNDFLPEGKTIFIPDARPQNMFPGFLWPTFSRVITGGYGWRRNPFKRRYREFHHGLDIRAKYQRVRSTKYGKITYSGWLGGYGKSIIVAHPGGIKSLYAHLSRIFVRKGQYVKQGQFIGRTGNTGRSTGAHLHFEILKNGSHKNPYPYLKRRR